jgi:hypothetical protein
MGDPHETLNVELEKDLDVYMDPGTSYRITDALWNSVKRWPVAEKEFVVYRGQPKEFAKLPLQTIYDRRPFFSATWGIAIAKKFGEGGNVFKITVQPGVRFLKLTHTNEAEVLLASDGIADMGAEKVWVVDTDTKARAKAIPVVYSPKPASGSGRRSKTRRRQRVRRNSRLR